MHFITNCIAIIVIILELIDACNGGDDDITYLDVGAEVDVDVERDVDAEVHLDIDADIRDVGSLMNRAGFKLLTIDIDELEVSYPSMFHLMSDLQDMAENGAAYRRARHISRDVLYAAASIYKHMYGKEGENESCPATFQIIYCIGWRAGSTTPVPAKRGSATASLKDLSGSTPLTVQKRT